MRAHRQPKRPSTKITKRSLQRTRADQSNGWAQTWALFKGVMSDPEISIELKAWYGMHLLFRNRKLGIAWPSLKKMMAISGCSRPATVSDARRALVDRGLLEPTDPPQHVKDQRRRAYGFPAHNPGDTHMVLPDEDDLVVPPEIEPKARRHRRKDRRKIVTVNRT